MPIDQAVIDNRIFLYVSLGTYSRILRAVAIYSIIGREEHEGH